MKTLINDRTDPRFNLALEEYLLKYKKLDDDLFYIWRNKPSIIIGRNQNPFREVNMKYANYRKLEIIRRVSGGGAVYHDLGNINFTFITHNPKTDLSNYQKFTQKIINVLERMGLQPKFVPQSHIYIGDYKISGNAQSFHRGRVIHHGTLLFDSNLRDLKYALHSKRNIKSNAIKSRPADTKNIKTFLHISAGSESFMNFIRDAMFVDDYRNHLLPLTSSDLDVVNDMVKTKYSKWEWNIATSSNFTIRRMYQHKYYTFTINKGIISKITGRNKNGLRYLKSNLLYKRLDYYTLITQAPNKQPLRKLINNLVY